MKYEVAVTIKDSTAKSYLIEWFYKNYEIQTDNPLVQKVSKIAEDISVLIRTDEFGAVQEVVNWEEVRDYMQKAAKMLKKEFKKVPNVESMLDLIKRQYMSKEAIEANAIKDAIQFYTYHGGIYTLDEKLTGQLQMVNNYGGKPFDTEVSVSLDEINEADGNSIIRMHQSVNSKQLTDATYGYLKKLGTLGDQIPKREDFPSLSNDTWTDSRIHSGTGWIIYSKETRIIKAEDTTNIEERIIELK